MLVDGAIDAAVRGTISARKTLQHLKLQIEPVIVSVGTALVRGRQAILLLR